VRFLINHPLATAPAEISINLPTSTLPSHPFNVTLVAKSVPKPNVVQTSSKEKLLGSNSLLWKPTEAREQNITIQVDPAISLLGSMQSISSTGIFISAMVQLMMIASDKGHQKGFFSTSLESDQVQTQDNR